MYFLVAACKNTAKINDDFHTLWYNISTISSSDEQYVAKFTIPNNWQLICDSTVVGSDGIALDVKLVNSIYRTSSVFCEVINEGGVYDGEVLVSLYDADNLLIDTDSVIFTFSKPVKNNPSFATPLVSGAIITALVFAIVISLLIIRRRSDNNLIDDSETNQAMSGPPISGPPITTSTLDSKNHIINPTTVPEETFESSAGYPPVPLEGLPQGWTLEQWQYYGQQYLDMNNRE